VQTFQLPLTVDIYTKNGKIRQTFQLNKRNAQFMIPLPAAVEFIDIDPEKTLVGQILIDKSDADYLYQYEHAASFANRVGAIAYASKNPTNTISQQILTKALADPDSDLAATAILGVDLSNPTLRKSTEKTILTLAEKSEASVIRASAIQKLAQTKDKKYKNIILNGVTDKSYMVIASSIMAIKESYPDQLQQSLKRIDPDATEYLKTLITELSKS
jgi:aminopeptidase N